MKMPMASLHMGQRRMSRFAADGWEPNLRITPRTRWDCRAMFPIFFITNCIRRKKMAKLVERNYVTGIAQRIPAWKGEPNEPKRPARISRLVSLFRGLVSTIRIVAIRMRSANSGRRLRGWVAFVAYDGNGVVAHVHDQFLRLLFG